MAWRSTPRSLPRAGGWSIHRYIPAPGSLSLSRVNAVSQQGCTQHGYSVPFRVVELTVMSASAMHWGHALGPPWDTRGYATPALTTRPEMGVLSQGH